MQKIRMKHIAANPQLEGLCRLIPDVVYSQVQGQDLKLDLIVPWTAERPGFAERHPLIVFVQGSSWTVPDRCYQIPQLSFFARQGFVTATVGHRSIFEDAPFPAFLEDVKCAIRFLRANADRYEIDPNRVAVWGTSSGANAALLTGLTGDLPEYKTGEFADQSDRVQAVVSCFAPSDIKDLVWPARHTAAIESVLVAAMGSDETRWEETMAKYSPLQIAEKGKDYPAFLLLHGNSDVEVPFQQTVKLANRLRDCGAEPSVVCVDGAGHEWDFWSETVYREILTFLRTALS